MKAKNKKSIIALSLIILIVAFVGLGLWKKSDVQKTESIQQLQNSEDEGIVITSIESYSGPYMEDGTDEEVSDVMMITVKNNSENALQYAEAHLKLGDESAEFAFSTVPAGATVCVLEKNRMSYSGKTDVESIEFEHVVFFENELSLNENVLKISELEGALNIENVSGKDISGQVAVYYKTVNDGIYNGGITYRALVKDGMKAGEIRQVMTHHFSLENSEIMFVTYVP